jgi:TM2 domain-containing membrane protein YozV
MKGHILDFSVQSNSGSISGADGNRYYFMGAEWKVNTSPAPGMQIDFDVDGNQAKSIYMDVTTPATPSKDKIAAGLLAIFLGGWGVHKFYLGFTGPGLVFLLTNTIGFAITWLFLFIPNIVLGVIALIEGIIYLTRTDSEFEQLYVKQKKQWF